VAGDAVTCAWPGEQDVVLMSWILSALREPDVGIVLEQAWHSLRPGGLLVLHDFMLDDPGPGPALAALWFLQYLAYQSDSASFSAADLRARLRRTDFLTTTTEDLIPGITKVVLARKAPPDEADPPTGRGDHPDGDQA